jgi:hypothetical protein
MPVAWGCLRPLCIVLSFACCARWIFQGLVGKGGHGRVVKATIPSFGLVALKELLFADKHSIRELEVVSSFGIFARFRGRQLRRRLMS